MQRVRSLRILLVEGNLLTGALLAEMLADLGHDICGAEITDAGGVRAAVRTSPDLMIVDSGLAGHDGGSAAIPRIFLSVDAAFAGQGRAIVLQKPYTQAEIVDAIRQTMS